MKAALHLGVGGWVGGGYLLSQFVPLCYFPYFSALPKHMLTIDYHFYIWQMSLQLSCDDTCQIWMRFNEPKGTDARLGMLLTKKIKNGVFVTPTPVLSSRFANLNVYYFMILNTPSLAGDFYLNFFLVCGVEIPAYTVSIVIIKYVSSKR